MNRQSGALSADAYMAFFRTGELPRDVPQPPPSATDGLGVVERQPEPQTPAYRLPHGQAYAEQYRRAEERALMERAAPAPADADADSTVTGLAANMSRLEVDTYDESLAEPAAHPAAAAGTEVYSCYDFNHVDGAAARLPIHAKRKEIVDKVNAFEVVVLEGHTGCGKTTQVPQYLLDEAHRLGRHAHIVVTQPRRIAAVSVARRVARERNWPLGTLVGYEIGLDKRTGPDTRLTYCTTGVLLQQLVHEGNMNRFTHVVLDEVHERDTDTDFALLLVRRLLRTNSRHVKVVLMSATFNTHLFAQYFAVPVFDRLDPAPIISCGSEQMFVTTVHYLDELGELRRAAAQPELEPEPDRSLLPQASPSLYGLVAELLKVMNKFDVADFGTSTQHPRFGAQRGSVLVFLPGMHEIQELAAVLEPERIRERWHVLPLHSMITGEEQATVFEPMSADQRKIILSTNIAESSITVTDVKYVVDFCLTKELEMDAETGYPKLRMRWASKANCVQRQGRAGRVSSGRVYRLVTSRFYDNLEQYSVPEMLRSPLEHVVLKAKKFCAASEPKAVLALALEPPRLEKIYSAVLHLKEVGALIDVPGAARFNPFDGELTVLGHVMAALPVDVNVARLLALGHAYGCLRECLVIAAGLTAKSFFARPFYDELRAYQSKLSWANRSFSDCLAILNVYEVWQDHLREGHYERSGGRSERQWAEKNFLQIRCLKDMEALRCELERRLDSCNIRALRPGSSQRSEAEQRREQALVLQLCIAGAFYPNYLLRLFREEREVDANRELSGRDPRNTVTVTGLPRDSGVLYYGQLVRQLRFNPTDPDPKVTFECSKAYVEFPVRRGRGAPSDEAGEGDIPLAVYLAVRLGQIRNRRLSIMRYPLEEEQRKKEQYAALEEQRRGVAPTGPRPLPTCTTSTRGVARPDSCRLPGLHKSVMPVLVTHVEDPGHFFVRYRDPQSDDAFVALANAIDTNVQRCLPPSCRPQLGHLYLAPYTEQGLTQYFRARLDVLRPHDCLVYFIDFGNTSVVRLSQLLDFSPEMVAAGVLETQALAVECSLSQLKPAQAMAGRWDQRAIDKFRELALYRTSIGHVYSVVHGRIHIELFLQHNQSNVDVSCSVNKTLMSDGLAEFAVEGHFSRQNHAERELGYSADGAQEDWQERRLADDPELTGWLKRQEGGCVRQQLRGPDSPLLLTLHGVPRSLHTRPAFVDTESCNSVLLDTEPHNPFDRLLVAAQVTPTGDGSRIRAQATTLMPSVPGLPALVVLLFAPVVELRLDPERATISGALCGLGGDPDTNQAVYPDHDVELTFDVAITTNDLLDVNVLRASFWMLYGPVEADVAEPHRLRESDRSSLEQQVRRRRRLLALLGRRRVPLAGRRRQARAPFRWGRLPASERLEVRLEGGMDERLEPFLICGVSSVQAAERADLRQRVVELFTVARNVDIDEPHHCPLCQVTTPTPVKLWAHINTKEHLRKAQKLFDDDDDEDGDED